MSIRWQAEWERQESVWFSWPHNNATWNKDGSLMLSVEQDFVKLISLISQTQRVDINAEKERKLHIIDLLTKGNALLENIHIHPHPTDDVWCRDHGATFVTETLTDNTKQLRAIDWHFNAWGGKFPPWENDDKIAQRMAEACQCAHSRSKLFLEGGAIEGNGAGVVLTTEAVALNPNRNPDWSKAEVETELKTQLGADTIFWLPKGIEGDDTDGHIDDLTRFIKEDAILTAVDRNSGTENYHTLETNKEILQDLKTATGSSVEVIDLPLPDIIRQTNWRLDHLPASYANFLILNELVIVPTFDQHRNDDRALGILRECFPNRQVIGFDSHRLIIEGGAVHCISQQQPAVDK